MKARAYILISIVFLAVNAASAASFMPVVTNYDVVRYEAQNWCITQDNDGIIYVANNMGILEFDGFKWQSTPIPGASVVRSVYAENDRIYAGAFEEFGYYTHDDYGSLRYTSLSDSLADFTFENEDIWGITRCGNILYFNSFRTAFAYDGKSVRVAGGVQGLRPLYIFTAGGKVYAQMVEDDVYILEDDIWRKVFDRAEIGDDNVVSITALSGLSGLLVLTERSGIFLMRHGRLARWATDADNALRNFRINRVATTRDGLLWIGTLQNGIYAIDKNGSLRYHYNMDNGLNNNSVLGLFADAYDNIWAALDDGIDMIHHGSPVRMLTLGPSDPRLGMVYSVGRVADRLCFAANQGFYFFDAASGLLTEHPDMRNQNWDISSFSGTTFVANNINTYIYDALGAETMIQGSSTDIARGRINGRDVLVQTSYHTMRTYVPSPSGGWTLAGEVDGFGAPVRKVAIDTKGNIWCAHINRGLIKVRLSDDLLHVESMKTYFDLGASMPHHDFSLMEIRGETLFTDGDSIYSFDDAADRFTSAHPLNADIKPTKDINSSTAVNDTLLWLAAKDSYTLVEYASGHYHARFSVPVGMFPRRNNRTNGEVFVDDDGTSYLSLNGTVASVARDALAPEHTVRPVLALNRVETQSSDTLVLRPVRAQGEVEAGSVARFSFAYPAFGGSNVRFTFRLIHRGDTSVQTLAQPEVTYLNLFPGSYTLTACAEDDTFGRSNTVTYRFSVPTPLPLRWWAILLYIAAIAAAGWAFSVMRVRRRLRRQKLEFDARHAEQQALMLEQQRIIAEQKARLLESELTSKSKELASMALNVTSKQQVIESLRQSLNDRRRYGGSDTRLASEMLRKIESENTNTREFWSVFERNFDLIHEHFFRNLRARYPSLTAGDLKFCALLRLNLSTKEIANFTNLTIRGVETARYRLRRKLALPEGASLVRFLIGLNETPAAEQANITPPH